MIRRTFGILLAGNGNGVQGLGAGVLYHRKKHGTSLPSHEAAAGRSPRAHVVFPRAALSRIIGEDSKVQRVSACQVKRKKKRKAAEATVASAAFRFFL